MTARWQDGRVDWEFVQPRLEIQRSELRMTLPGRIIVDYNDGRFVMTAFNAVRFRVKPGREQEFLDAHRKAEIAWPGLQRANLIKTGDRTYCIIVEWADMDALAKARPDMIAMLDTIRDMLEDVGGGLGVTDPVSGPVVLALK